MATLTPRVSKPLSSYLVYPFSSANRPQHNVTDDTLLHADKNGEGGD